MNDLSAFLRSLILWLDRPRHPDWRPAPFRADLLRRWCAGRWQYRAMTDVEARQRVEDEAW